MVKATDRNVILISIHPRFAKAIFRGEKKVEFRKLNIPKSIEYIVLYITAPESKVAGYFRVKDVVEASAEELWRKFHDVSGTTKEFFFSYYGKEGRGRGFMVEEVHILQNPIPLDRFNGGEGKPPQSFTYVNDNTWKKLKNRKKSINYQWLI